MIERPDFEENVGIIRAWVNHRTVSTDDLLAQLKLWVRFFEENDPEPDVEPETYAESLTDEQLVPGQERYVDPSWRLLDPPIRRIWTEEYSPGTYLVGRCGYGPSTAEGSGGA